MHDQVPVTAVRGEIDMGTEQLIQDAVGAELAERPALLVLDLTEVGYMGSVGLNLLVCNHVRARDQGTRLAVVASGGFVRRALVLSGVDNLLELHHDLESALRSG
ncbi:STAS domain-containing protein [Lentzea sp. NEAU-D13]|uniref:Anti-sigma factor antagonist n=1 Tax=Lentzea alba TaxID=2714351 RepID=A0A7C9RQE9_9PSEU|nr:STAS domain-containing protein [Lentzea alba]NGY60369.1 STAS domain-containing protein [Lentzea alba]